MTAPDVTGRSSVTATLGDLLAPDPGAPAALQLRQAVVTATATGPASLTIRVGGSSTAVAGVRYLSSYTPAVNDVVFVVQAGADLLVLGRLA